MQIKPPQFYEPVLKWFVKYGRKNLPWQKPKSAYRVWLSEIMLQQTQVTTVIPYFQKFIKQFPTIQSLANAHVDEVLTLWAGLGYYARARNLHKTAKIICTQFKNKFPQNLEALQSLPGIGRSTAGAILALSMNQHAAILDGNVKRVLARFHAIANWPGEPKTQQQLWHIAEYYTPKNNTAEYTQAMMDLGATVCTRSKPKCDQCPLQKNCQAFAQGNPTAYPITRKSKKLPIRATRMLIIKNKNHEILLEKRPPVGIWGGLWSLPECPIEEDIQQWCKQQYRFTIHDYDYHESFRHTFSHFHLDITPITTQIKKQNSMVMDGANTIWQDISKLNTKGLAAPVKKLLRQMLSK